MLADLKLYPEASRDMWLLAYWKKDKLQQRIYELWLETFAEFVEREQGDFFCEKSPSHALRIADIHNMLPEARFIHIIRDSRSTIASLLAAGRSWGKTWAPKSALEASTMWYLHVHLAKKAGANLSSNQYIEVYYEDLKQSTEQELTRIFKFIGVDFSEELLLKIVAEQDFDNQKKIGGSKFKTGLQKPEPSGFFRKGEIDSWKNDLTWWEKAVIWKNTRKLMAVCGYSWQGRKR